MAKIDEPEFNALAIGIEQQIEAASALKLDFAVRLLRMALIEVRLNAHDITQAEINEFCSRIQSDALARGSRPSAQVISLAEIAVKHGS